MSHVRKEPVTLNPSIHPYLVCKRCCKRRTAVYVPLGAREYEKYSGKWVWSEDGWYTVQFNHYCPDCTPIVYAYYKLKS